jgi:hydroxyacylglutathione hydrolase
LCLGDLELEVLDTPGHTMSHVCLLWRNGAGGKFFSGDTLFNAGAGNCHHGGHPEALYNTFSQVLSHLGDAVELYPGHDYLERNLAFTLDREPGNTEARRLLDRQRQPVGAGSPSGDPGGRPQPPEVLTMGEERKVNVFLRLDHLEVRSGLSTASGRAPESDQACFLALRSLRNRW